MKHLIMFSLLVLFLVSVQFSNAQTVDEVINKHLDAIGGKDKIAQLKSLKMEGSLSTNGIDVNITTTVLHGVGSRVDIAVPGMGEGYQIMNTTKGWNFMPFAGQSAPEEVPAEDVKNAQNTLDVQGAVYNYKEKGNTVELLGKEKVDNVDCFKIKVTTASGKVTTSFIDATTYYRVKSITMAKTPEGEQEMETTYSDFKKNADGYVYPYSQTNPRGTIVFSNIEVNKPVDESIFTVK
ncbi:MAG: hypothetical protein RLY16_909 [Bacteroidota bacterium]|jgi:hypothetical protein